MKRNLFTRFPRVTVFTAAFAVLLSAACVVLTVKSWGGESKPNNTAARSRPTLLAGQRRLRDILGLSPDQIEKFHTVERKYLSSLKNLGSLPIAERRLKRDEITMKIDSEVKAFLSDDQYAKLLAFERQSGSFRSRQ